MPIHHVDDLDVRIFRELGSPSSLQWNVRETYSSIARRIGVDEETVRRRVKRAEKLGSLAGWRMMPNPHLVECQAAGIDLEVADEAKKEEILNELKRVNGIIKVLDFRGSGLQITLYYPDEVELQNKTQLIKSICSPRSEPALWKMRFPSSNYKFTTTDWEIVQEMLEDARKSLETVSESIGVSLRTVSRRLASMVEKRAVYLQGTPNFRNFSGLSCVFLMFCPDLSKKKIADDMVINKMPRIEIFNTNSPQYSTFVAMFDNLTQADEFTKFIQGLDGVSSLKMGIMKDLIVIQTWLRKEIGRRISVR